MAYLIFIKVHQKETELTDRIIIRIKALYLIFHLINRNTQLEIF
jgi:hypothetical protein